MYNLIICLQLLKEYATDQIMLETTKEFAIFDKLSIKSLLENDFLTFYNKFLDMTF